MPDAPQERRRSIRRTEHGIVFMVTTSAPERQRISGALIDVSDHGFRVRHLYAGFQPGEFVSFIHRKREGFARVVWHKPEGSDFETGFSYSEE
ncbi:MAG TPA: PilZ domain-containing protein [Bryobacteraceae bacterium]|nr:PilZ domain-containing protein [Bryobacteraceae bacterium]